jgi:D-glycero-D-manno-heptose 1,7-bisphosphate phosphatase
MSKVVLLDRDGVINRKAANGDYVKTWNEFSFLPGAIEAIRLLTQHCYSSYIITNQRGIARGLMTEQDLKVIHEKMLQELKKHGAEIKQIYYCPHGDEDRCDCRKPKPGLLLRAARENGFDLSTAVFIGDDRRDAEAGENAGCKVIMVKPGNSLLDVVRLLISPCTRS